MENNYNQIAGQRTQRIEAISDGVFAIALTLLIFNIKVPVGESIKSEKNLMEAFLGLAPQMLSYFLSFITLGIYWSAHSTQFHFIVKSNRTLNWINLFFLLFVSTIPFTTAFLSQYITFRFAVFLYWLNIIMLGLILALHWNYANRNKFISISENENLIISKAIKRRVVESSLLYTIGASLSLINSYLSIIVLISIQLNYALGLISGSQKHKAYTLKADG
ncbi:MAG: TMEM175 family protein [Bacteroidota bacterium]|nr:TMEM175 family protein [Bacteroidota bacterium]